MRFREAFALVLIPTACRPTSSEEVLGEATRDIRETLVSLQMAGGCQREWPQQGTSTFLPKMETRCYASPTKQCQAVDNPQRPFQFSYAGYKDDPVWGPLFRAGYKTYPTLYHHQQIEWQQTDENCQVKIHALADMDGDSIFSTYTRNLLFSGAKYSFLGDTYIQQEE